MWHQRLKCWNLWEFLWLSVSPGTLHGNLLKSCLAESEEGTRMDLPFFWSHLQLQPCSPAVSYFLLTLFFMNLNIKTISHSRAHFIISGLWSFLSKCIQCMSEVEYLERFDELAGFSFDILEPSNERQASVLLLPIVRHTCLLQTWMSYNASVLRIWRCFTSFITIWCFLPGGQ